MKGVEAAQEYIMIKVYLSCLFIFSMCSLLHAQKEDNLQRHIGELLIQQKLTGAVWSIVSENGKINTYASGYKNFQTKDILESKDQVLVGSISKTIMAAGFLRLATIGKIQLNDPVKKYLPDLPIINNWEISNPVTIKHLLDHTSGLTDAKLWQVFSTSATPTTPLDYVFSKSPEVLTVQVRPGSMYSYSNIGYSILGMVLEAIGNIPYEKFLNNLILEPLGMRSSSFLFVTQNENRRLAFGHYDDGTPIYAMPMYLRAAGQFVTNAEDMGKFLYFMMSDGIINGAQFISEKYLLNIGKQTTTDAYIMGVPYGDALGAYSRDRYGVVGIAKNGNTLGFVSMIYMFPAYKKAFFIGFNMDSEISNYDLFYAALIKHISLPRKPFISSSCTVEEEINRWDGYYVPVITKVFPFRLIDIIFSHTKVEILKSGAKLIPFQGRPKNLTYQGGNLFSMEDRTNISHVFYYDQTGNYLISDGVKTIKKVSGIKIITIVASLVLGFGGMLYLFVGSLLQLFKSKVAFIKDPCSGIFLALVILFIALAFVAKQSFVQMGDFTIGNLLLAIATILLPLFSFLSVVLLLIKHKEPFLEKRLWASLLLFQFCVLLVSNEVFPLFMWK